MTISFSMDKLVLQPTSLCNLNCLYCYLPQRDLNRRMPIEVAQRIADDLNQTDRSVTLIWHGGEPLATGYGHFVDLIAPFEHLERAGRVKHAIQTNASLIDERWCELFVTRGFHVGVSIDGPKWANSNRIDWIGASAFARIMRGIEMLVRTNIEFYALAVVTEESIDRAAEFYEFFCDLGCYLLGINIEEREGTNQQRSVLERTKVSHFWSELFQAWRTKPTIEIREFSNALSWMKHVCDGDVSSSAPSQIDILPTISRDGNIIVLSPELLGDVNSTYNNFVVGNILVQTLSSIIEKPDDIDYVRDFISGVEYCRHSCEYFSFCQGGNASNKYFELGRLDGTETVACINAKKLLVDAILEAM